jgi:hypothetical protein
VRLEGFVLSSTPPVSFEYDQADVETWLTWRLGGRGSGAGGSTGGVRERAELQGGQARRCEVE